jgi:hypothetical protein
MRAFGILTVSTLFLGAAAVPAAAQSVAEAKTLTVTPFLSTSFGVSRDLGSSLGIGAAVGYDWTSNLGFEAELGRVFDVAGDDDNVDYRLTTMNANVVYHFDVKRVTPYATLGMGWQLSDPEVKDPALLTVSLPPSSTEIAWNFGGGAKMEINNRLLARADLRRFQANDLAPDHWRVYGGLTFWIKR